MYIHTPRWAQAQGLRRFLFIVIIIIVIIIIIIINSIFVIIIIIIIIIIILLLYDWLAPVSFRREGGGLGTLGSAVMFSAQWYAFGQATQTNKQTKQINNTFGQATPLRETTTCASPDKLCL